MNGLHGTILRSLRVERAARHDSLKHSRWTGCTARFFEAFALNGLHGTILRSIRQNQGSDGQICETFVKIRGRMAKFAKHSSKSGATPGRRPAEAWPTPGRRLADVRPTSAFRRSAQKLTTVSHFSAFRASRRGETLEKLQSAILSSKFGRTGGMQASAGCRPGLAGALVKRPILKKTS